MGVFPLCFRGYFIKNIMQKFSISIVFILFFSLTTIAQNKKEISIETIEKQRFAAMEKKDIPFLEDVLADDLVYIHSNALTETKTDFLSSIKTGKIVYEKMDVEEMQVRRYGRTTAIVNGIVHVQVQLNGKPADLRLRYTNVYIKQNGTWKMETWQSTKIP